ncbi:MAG: alpha/beta hydrolase-fold protein, partial [Pirellulaceae bacterium]|nr:alpha/beta hydrolase-fold protein [Pirellulaceae bacterium]
MYRSIAAALLAMSVLGFSAVAWGQEDAPNPDDQYVLGEDSQRKEGVPQGKVTQHEWRSTIFPDTIREYYLYVPAEEHRKGQEDFAVMVFQDGHAYVKEDGQFRTPIVLDNLIQKKELPPIVGIFINPGHRGESLPRDPWRSSNRSFEYDTLSDQYARFLLEEMLPEAEKQTGLKLSTDPERRAICGMSSGGICAWTVAWE